MNSRNTKDILLSIDEREKRIALLKYGRLQDLVIERQSTMPLTGNIYRGQVTNILHNIQSAFIDISEGENGFIHISDILENTQKFQEMFDMEFEWDYDISTVKQKDVKEADISNIMKLEQTVLVQVVKEPMGSKGARLTSNITIPGRYLVLLPNTRHRGVSRKIQDRVARDRLKKLIRGFEMPQDMGLICRTASVDASDKVLIKEATDLLKSWQEIMDGFKKANKPTLLLRESSFVKRAVLTAVDNKFNRLLVDDYKTYQECRKLYQQFKSEHVLKLEYYRDQTPIFERFGVEGEIDKALKRKVWLPNGGYLIIDKTEAMTTIDVNSGRSLSTKRSVSVEEALVHINMEAAEEIARQLRIRNIGGLIICDFIDMRSRKNQRRVLDHLKEAMKEDNAKCTVLGMSEFGLVEMTRQRTRESLHQTLFTDCPYCNGKGFIKNNESVSIEMERAVKRVVNNQKQYAIELVYHPELDRHLTAKDKKALVEKASKIKAVLKFRTRDDLHVNDYEFYSLTNGEKIEV